MLQVAPSNIETQLMTHPAVKDVAVVGLPHDIDGEHPLAYVVIKTNQEGQPLANPQELIDFTNGLKTELFDATRTIFKTNELNYNQKK
jgi:acyl-coenzyme A synthetase/AMP-(fatty) acid ligase